MSNLGSTCYIIYDNYKYRKPSILVEVLSPDFAGNLKSLQTLLDSGLHVFAHNIETVENLTRLDTPTHTHTHTLN